MSHCYASNTLRIHFFLSLALAWIGFYQTFSYFWNRVRGKISEESTNVVVYIYKYYIIKLYRYNLYNILYRYRKLILWNPDATKPHLVFFTIIDFIVTTLKINCENKIVTIFKLNTNLTVLTAFKSFWANLICIWPENFYVPTYWSSKR